ncbi:MAG: hypothetical protein WBF79_11000 [Rhodococcus sp. (in: high G+C Gram-positive bacteria)]
MSSDNGLESMGTGAASDAALDPVVQPVADTAHAATAAIRTVRRHAPAPDHLLITSTPLEPARTM